MTTSSPARRPPDRVVAALCCPICRQDLRPVGASLGCPAGHNFDIARQGYVNLVTTSAANHTGDTATMVADRAEFLAAGHYAPLAELITTHLPATDGLVIDAGAGIGYYLRAVLDAQPDAAGLALDRSPVALRRAARAHQRLGAAVVDLWQPWPVLDGVAAAVLNVFAPRNAGEFHRVLRPDGRLLVVTPTEAHLAELGAAAGLLAVDPRKEERLAGTLAEHFHQIDTEALTLRLTLSPEDVRRVVGMGPAAHHGPGTVPSEPSVVTASFVLSVYRPR